MTSSTSLKSLSDWLEHCERGHPLAIDMTLDRAREVKERLGIRFDVPVVAVAGTNGKGSTCAILESIGRHAGWRVGLYSKPHILRFEERCRINGTMVDEAALVPHFEAVESARGDISLTYFEHTTLAILRLLSQTALDLVILEVGLGGRRDAVNVVDADCAVVTGIDIDHTEYLGPDRESIGFEKAGIFRQGKPAVIGDEHPPESLIRYAHQLGTPLRVSGYDFKVVKGTPYRWTWKGWRTTWRDLPLPRLVGAGQLQNSSTALAVIDSMPLPRPSYRAIFAGLREVNLPGRFQTVSTSPRVIIDVAHNLQSVRMLASTLGNQRCRGRTFGVFGCMKDKDITEMIAEMSPIVAHWFIADLPISRAARASDLVESISNSDDHAATAFKTVTEALTAAKQQASHLDRIVVFGSFITVSEALKSIATTKLG